MEQLFHKHNTEKWFESAIHGNIHRFLNSQPPTTAHPWSQPAVDSQTTIGWGSIFYGIFSKSWIESHDRHSQQTSRGLTIVSKLIKIIFQAVINCWNSRNHQLHQHSIRDELKTRLTSQLKALYALKNKLLASDRTIFDIPLNTLLTKSPRTIRLFIDQHKPIVKQSVHQQQKLTQRQHHDIASYFQTPGQKPTTTRVTQDD